MILNNSIKIEIIKSNLNYYKRLKPNLLIGDLIEIPINELSDNSGLKVDIRCDYCGDEFRMEYRKYLRSISISIKNSCKNDTCKSLKIKDSNFIKYGVSNVMQLDDVKLRAKQSNLDKWGTENPNQLPEIKDKIKKTNHDRYGVDHPMYLDVVKNKLKLSINEKYGVDNVNKLKWVRDKIKETNIKNWGVDNYTKTDEYRIKKNKTNLETWGSETLSHSEDFRKKNFTIANHSNYLRRLIEEQLNEFNCDCGELHTFKIHSDNFYQRISLNNPLCTECYPIGNFRSVKEEEIFKFIRTTYSGEIIQSYRDKLEIDIYIPDLKLGFEFNGLIWHSTLYKERDYHLTKTDHFKERGIRIIHIWEDDWSFKNEIIKSQIKNILKKTDNRIYARKCFIKEIPEPKISKDFLDKNHIQGSNKSSLKLGLYFGNRLVSLMTFDHFEGRKKMTDDEWNLSRFCNIIDTNVIGGASKLLYHFIKRYNPKRIISYSDKDWSVGSLYSTLGFNGIGETRPDYKYFINNKRIHKSRFRRSYTGISESQLTIPKIWDCGKIKWEKQNI